MKKTVKIFPVFLGMVIGLFLYATPVRADIPIPRDSISTRSMFDEGSLILSAGIVVSVALVSWLVIRSIRKKNKENAINK